jgi:hypothetical protein
LTSRGILGAGAGQDERRIEAVRREATRRRDGVAAVPVDGVVRAQATRELDAIGARGDGQHARTDSFRELQCEMPDASAGAEDEERLVGQARAHVSRWCARDLARPCE